MRIEEFQRRLAKLREGAVGKVQMKVDQSKMEMVQRCTICKEQSTTKMEYTSEGDERLLRDLERFQAAHVH